MLRNTQKVLIFYRGWVERVRKMEDCDETFSIENALIVNNLLQLYNFFNVTFNSRSINFVTFPIVLCPPPSPHTHTSCSVMSPNGSSHTASSHIHIPKEYTSEYIVWGESGSVSRLRGLCMTSGAVQRRDDGQPLNWPWPEMNWISMSIGKNNFAQLTCFFVVTQHTNAPRQLHSNCHGAVTKTRRHAFVI